MLPSRLKNEMALLSEALVSGADIRADERISAHAEWADELKEKYSFTRDNVEEILRKEIGIVFSKVLEHAGVYKRNAEGKAAFLRFIGYVNEK